MSDKDSVTKKPEESPRRSWPYIFGVTALAMFLLVIVLGRSKSRMSQATAVLHATSIHGKPPIDQMDKIRKDLVRSEILHAAVDHVKANYPSRAADLDVAAVRGQVQVNPRQAPPGHAQLAVTFKSSESDVARTLVNRICEEFSRQQSGDLGDLPVPSPAFREAIRTAELAQADYRMAQTRLNAFINQHYEQHDTLSRDDALDRYQTEPATLPEAGAPAPEELTNPRSDALFDLKHSAVALEEQLAGLASTRNKLLEHMTQAHPQIRILNKQIADLQLQLKGLHDGLAALENSTVASVTRAQQAHSQSQVAVQQLEVAARQLAEVRERHQQQLASVRQQHQQLLAEYEQLRRTADQADLAKARLNAEERREWEQRFAQRPTLVWHVEPATEEQRVASPISVPLLLLAGLIGLICGAAVLMATSSAGSTTIDNNLDAQQSLHVPVVGSITESKDAPPRRRRELPGFARAAVFCAEIMLFAAFASMAVAAMLDTGFAQQFNDSPITALADGSRCLVEMCRR